MSSAVALKKPKKLRPITKSDSGSTVFSTSLGWMGLTWNAGGLHRLTLGHDSPRKAADRIKDGAHAMSDPPAAIAELVERIQDFADGKDDDFLDVQLNLNDLTTFQRSVVRHCRRIPIGKTMTYAQLAAKAGSPQAARAVGNVMASNRFALIVPCHRVVGSGGSLGGYSAPTGLKMKRRLLEREGTLARA